MNLDKTFIIPWQMKSLGAHALSRELGIRRILRTNSKFVGSSDKTVINWGCSEVSDEIKKCKIINYPQALEEVINKLKFFALLNRTKAARIPQFTTNAEEAMEWVKDKKEVVGRSLLTSHSGNGIVFYNDNLDDFLASKMFTLYIPKKEEYRVHIMRGKVIDVQQKTLRKTDADGNPINPKEVDFRVRSYKNGFIFQRQGITPDKDVLDQAVNAFRATKLDFGAVDVIFNDKSKQAYVLEINSSPGLEGVTISSYAEAFKELR